MRTHRQNSYAKNSIQCIHRHNDGMAFVRFSFAKIIVESVTKNGGLSAAALVLLSVGLRASLLASNFQL